MNIFFILQIIITIVFSLLGNWEKKFPHGDNLIFDKKNLNTDEVPGSRCCQTSVISKLFNASFVYGGFGYSTGLTKQNLGDLWKIDLKTGFWTLLHELETKTSQWPGKRSYPLTIMHYSPTEEKIFLFGGKTSTKLYNDVYVKTLNISLNNQPNFHLLKEHVDGNSYNSSIGYHSQNRISGRTESGMFQGIDIDNNGESFYIFGGKGKSFSGLQIGYLNDLWQFDVNIQEWRWIGPREPKINMRGVGYINDYNGNNWPGCRKKYQYWQNVNLVYIYGGRGIDKFDGDGLLSDLWALDLNNLLFKFVSGSVNGNSKSIIISGGDQTGNTASSPSGRAGSSGWIGGDKYLFMFGGFGLGVMDGNGGFLNDLWAYSVDEEMWYFVSGNPEPSYSHSTIPYSRAGAGIGHFVKPDSTNAVFVFGGVSQNDYVNILEKYIRDLWYSQHGKLCFGIEDSKTEVCSNNGVCVDYDNCSCTGSYTGNKCNEFTCFGLGIEHQDVCSGKGFCDGEDKCICNDGYFGMKCDEFMCLGIPSNSSEVCHGDGMCVHPNVCNCSANFAGMWCQYSKCFGKLDYDTYVCSSHGDCIDGNCNCEQYWTGNECESFFCNQTDCAGHGTCVGPNKCACVQDQMLGYWGILPFDDNCDYCSPSFTGTYCNETYCDNATTCNNHGICNNDVGPLCNCFSSAAGYWEGIFCTKCQSGYYGEDCDVNCDRHTTCNGNGVCNQGAGDVCSCYKGEFDWLRYTYKGSFDGSNCENCSNSYFGDKCEIFVDIANLTMTSDLNKIVGIKLRLPDWHSNIVYCEDVIKNTALLGTSDFPAICGWEFDDSATNSGDNTGTGLPLNFYVKFGKDPKIKVGDVLCVNLTGIGYPEVEVCRQIGQPEQIVLVDVVAVIVAPDSLGKCANLVLDGSKSTGGNIEYKWSSNDNAIDSYLSPFNGHTVIIPSYLVQNGDTFYSLNVTHKRFGNSNSTTVMVTKNLNIIPAVQIVGPTKQFAQRNGMFLLEGKILTNYTCMDANSGTNVNFFYEWSVVQAPVQIIFGSSGITVNKKTLYIPAGVLSAIGSYIFKFRVQISIFSIEAYVEVYVDSKDLQCGILQGDRMVFNKNPLFITAVANDPDESSNQPTFSWECKNVKTYGFCLPSLDSSQIGTSKNLFISKDLMKNVQNGEYEMTFMFSKGDRSCEETVIITVTDEILSTVSIEMYPPSHLVNIRQKLSFFAKVMIHQNLTNDDYTFEWVKVSGPAADINRFNTFTPLGDRILGFKEDIFIPGAEYEYGVRLLKFNSSGDSILVSKSSIKFKTNDVPRNGYCDITYQGVPFAMQTEFTIMCNQWIDDHLPLSYTFGYEHPMTQSRIIMKQKTLSSSATFKVTVNGPVIFFVMIFDSYGSWSVFSQTLGISKPVINDYSSYAQNFLDDTMRSGEGNYFESMANLQNAAFFMDDVSNSTSEQETLTFRSNLLNNLKQTVDNSFDIDDTIDTISNQIIIINAITTNKKTGNLTSVNEAAMDILTNVVGKDIDLLDKDTVVNAFTSLSDIYLSSDENLLRNNDFSEKIYNTTRKFTRTLMRKQLSGDDPFVVENDGLKSLVWKNHKRNIHGKLSISDLNITIPEGVGDLVVGTDVSIVINVFTINPYRYLSNENISSDIISLEFEVDDIEISVSNLTEPIIIVIPGVYILSDLELDETKPGKRMFCSWWDNTDSSWSTEGCELKNITSSYIICECTHATDFGAFIKDSIPDLNLLTPEDWLNITKLNPDNIVTLIVLCILTLIYLTLMFSVEVLQICKLTCAYRISRRKIRDVNSSEFDSISKSEKKDDRKYIQKLIEIFVGEHKYFSVIFPFQEELHFTTGQRITVIYVSILGAMMSNALTFGTSNKSTLQFITSVILSNLMTAPFAIVFGFMFLRTKVRKKSSTVFPTPTDEIEVKGQEEKELDEKDETPKTIVETETKEETPIGLVETDKIESSSAEVKAVEETKKDIVEAKDTPKEKEEEKTLIDIKKEEKTSFKRCLDCLLEKSNDVIHCIYMFAKRVTKKFTWHGMVLLIFITILYIGVVIGLSFLLYSEVDWMGSTGVALFVSLAILLYFGTLEVLFILAKIRNFVETKDEEEIKRRRRFSIIQVVIGVLLFIISFCLIAAFIVFMFVIPNFPIEISISAILLFVGFTIIAVVWIVFALKSPKKGKVRQKRRYIEFPWWMKYVIYLICWTYMIVVSYILVLYGIKFDSETDINGVSSKWLLGSSTSAVEDIFIQEPVEIIFKTVVLVTLLQLFEVLFFKRSSGVKMKKVKSVLSQ